MFRDSGTTQSSKLFNQMMGDMNPDVFFVGGDIAYDDNMNACFYTWDYYFSDIERIFFKVGYMFPIVWAVGNHDVGLNENSLVNITKDLNGPPYLTYLPQHYDRDENFNIVKRIPQIENRRSIFYHDFANIRYLTLDSGYLHPFDGWQITLIKDALSSAPGKLKLVNYHVPIYR